MFYGFVTTETGNRLLASMVAGETLTITRVVMDKGTAESPEAARKLVAPIDPGPEGTSNIPTAEGNTANLIVEYRSDLNGGLEEGFWIGGFGIYGSAGGAEAMIGYGSLGDAKQYVSAYVPDTAPDVRRYPVSITVTSGAQVVIGYPAEAWMTAEDVDDKVSKHNSSGESHKDIRTALSNKVSHTADYVPAMQDLHGDARGLVCTVPAAAGPEIASINAPPGVEWGTCLSLQVGDIRTLMLIDTSGLWIQYGRPSGWTDWIHIATATPPQEYDLPLAEGWTSQISGSCRYAKSQENIVFVTFKVVHDEATPASTDTMIATLPEGFWPSALVHSVCIRSDFVSSGIAVFCTETGGIWIRSSQEIPSGAGVAGEIIFVAAS